MNSGLVIGNIYKKDYKIARNTDPNKINSFKGNDTHEKINEAHKQE